MIVVNQIAEYLIYESEPISRALEKINANKSRIVFVIDSSGILSGAISDGDFRRWLMNTEQFSISESASNVMNPHVTSLKADASRNDISEAFKDSLDVIPLVDSARRVVAVALQRKEGLRIGPHVISDSSPAFVIAEIGNNHNGSLELAKELIDLAVESGADCAKFQMRTMDALYKSGGAKDDAADLGAQYTLDVLSKFQLSNSELASAFDYCRSKGITPMCTPWDHESLEFLEDCGMEAYKVASADLTNHPFLKSLADTGKVLICSTGMSNEKEIRDSVRYLRNCGAEFVLLHCNSTYPTPFKDVNLSYLPRLKQISGGIIGYSGHERGIEVPIAAVAMGAKVIEKHFTVDRSMEGNDHKVSLLPDEMRRMIVSIRRIEESMGEEGERKITQGEMINRDNLAKSLISTRKLSKGQLITRDMIDIKSPGQGLQPIYMEELIGRESCRDMDEGDMFFESDIEETRIEARDYSFSRPAGIPVRYHDYSKLAGKSALDFVEFHLSYQDLDADLGEFFDGPQNIGLAIHSPELFSNDHLLDLCSPDKEYRDRSIAELNRVTAVSRDLKDYFPRTDRPVIVVNAGGFSTSFFMPEEERPAMYELVAESLSKVDATGVELIIQTMPPFPWHFGGQSYHNLFMASDEIASFCEKFGYRICFDLSHSMMACNYYAWDIEEFTRAIAPYTAHMHIVDALGVDGEGVKIGEGDVPFGEVIGILNELCPGVQFIPEVWQGHKNSGEGFWYALEYLENKSF